MDIGLDSCLVWSILNGTYGLELIQQAANVAGIILRVPFSFMKLGLETITLERRRLDPKKHTLNTEPQEVWLEDQDKNTPCWKEGICFFVLKGT